MWLQGCAECSCRLLVRESLHSFFHRTAFFIIVLYNSVRILKGVERELNRTVLSRSIFLCAGAAVPLLPLAPGVHDERPAAPDLPLAAPNNHLSDYEDSEAGSRRMQGSEGAQLLVVNCGDCVVASLLTTPASLSFYRPRG